MPVRESVTRLAECYRYPAWVAGRVLVLLFLFPLVVSSAMHCFVGRVRIDGMPPNWTGAAVLGGVFAAILVGSVGFCSALVLANGPWSHHRIVTLLGSVDAPASPLWKAILVLSGFGIVTLVPAGFAVGAGGTFPETNCVWSGHAWAPWLVTFGYVVLLTFIGDTLSHSWVAVQNAGDRS
jgi:hypothetical protein